MQHSSFQLLVSLSLIAHSWVSINAATRPRYGGTLHIEMQALVNTLNPEALTSGMEESIARRGLAHLVFDSLTQKDEKDQLRPGLAVAWKADNDLRRWELRLRPHVRLHDGSQLSPSDVVNALSRTLPGFSVSAIGQTLVVQSPTPDPNLPQELAEESHPVYVVSAEGKLLGTGPFQIAEWNPGQRILLASHEGYWGGRPFLDAVEIQMNRSPQEQLVDLELGKADVVELAPDAVRRAMLRNQRVWTSAPLELVALRFGAGRPAVKDKRLRKALALSIDRTAIHRVLLQKQGEPSGGLLPQWISGYAFLFPMSRDLEQARQLASGLSPAAKTASLAFDAGDHLAQLIAERVAVNCRDAGIVLQVRGQPPVPAFNPQAEKDDIRLVRLRMLSNNPPEALKQVLNYLSVSNPETLDASTSPEDHFNVENGVLQDYEVVPLFHLPVILGLSSRVRGWPVTRPDQIYTLPLDSIWLDEFSPTTSENNRELSN